jgi:hypothetical protein
MTIGKGTFQGCSSLLAPIEIPSLVTVIGDGSFGEAAFYGCLLLILIEVPSLVITIGEFTLYGCSSLILIEVPSLITTIGEAAFLVAHH